jgi:hypothetical protein
VRYFFRRRVPAVERVLLVESGSRSVIERLVPRVRAAFGPAVPIDLVTCYPERPAALTAESRVFRVTDYPGRAARRRLYRELRATGYSLTGILCSGEPIMTKWKWALAAQVPAKVFIINENADFFWLDYGQRHNIARFALARSGLAGTGAVRTAARLAAIPFTFVFLVLYAAVVHTRRAIRLAFSAAVRKNRGHSGLDAASL